MINTGSLWQAVQAHAGCRRCGRGYAVDPACLAAYLAPIAAGACPRCAQARPDGVCPSLGCRRGWLRFGTVRVALGYKRGVAERVLLAAKDRGSRRAVHLLARLLAGFLLADPAMPRYDLFLPVPFHPAALRGRAVHPLTAIYRDAAPALRARLPLDDLAPPFLVQRRPLPPLRGLPEARRWRTVRGAFALGFPTRMLCGARVAIIDDVLTTGATLSECARVIVEDAGASAADGIVLLREPWQDLPRAAHAADERHLTSLGGGV
jgi:predicted amidophosphoribosyltransferase